MTAPTHQLLAGLTALVEKYKDVRTPDGVAVPVSLTELRLLLADVSMLQMVRRIVADTEAQPVLINGMAQMQRDGQTYRQIVGMVETPRAL